MSLTCFSAQNPNDAQRFAAQHEDKKNVSSRMKIIRLKLNCILPKKDKIMLKYKKYVPKNV